MGVVLSSINWECLRHSEQLQMTLFHHCPNRNALSAMLTLDPNGSVRWPVLWDGGKCCRRSKQTGQRVLTIKYLYTGLVWLQVNCRLQLVVTTQPVNRRQPTTTEMKTHTTHRICVPGNCPSFCRNEWDCACRGWTQPCERDHSDSVQGTGRLPAGRAIHHTEMAIAASSHTGTCSLHAVNTAISCLKTWSVRSHWFKIWSCTLAH